MKFDIVVAHYKENIDWITKLNESSIRKVFVYSKDVPTRDFSSDKIDHRYLTNVGRESHTYLWHCVDKYEQIKNGEAGDFTFFLQGYPHGLGFKEINEWMEIVSSTGMEYTQNYRRSNPNDFLDRGRCLSWAGSTHPSGMTVREWCDRHIRKDAPFENIPIFWNACFGVSSRLISSCSKPMFVNLIQKELATVNPECGHFCERLWYYIFNMDSASDFKLGQDMWHFWGGPHGKNHYGVMWLKQDGTVGMYSNPNERNWSSDGDSIVLKDASMRPTSILKKVSDSEFSGPFLSDRNSIHRLTRHNPVEE